MKGSSLEASSEAGESEFHARQTIETNPLPPAWGRPSVYEDRIEMDGLEVRRAGLSSVNPEGEEILGSAASTIEPPLARAYFELLERASTLEWLKRAASSCALLGLDGEPKGRRSMMDVAPQSPEPARWRYARSNGVALHESWREACHRAYLELCERHRVLAAWYGESQPAKLAFDVEATSLKKIRSYEWLACSFPAPSDGDFTRDVHVTGVLGMPDSESSPVVAGFGAESSIDRAVMHAAREATQLLAFLWGESLPESDPLMAPNPAYHRDIYQRPERRKLLRRWLEEGHTRVRQHTPRPVDGADDVLFVDLTPQWLRGLRVSKAVCPAALSLVFGDDPRASHLPPELRAHPIA
jgi:hypothetical protein